MKLGEFSEKGDRNYNLDHTLHLQDRGWYIAAVIDGLGDKPNEFADNFIDKLRLEFIASIADIQQDPKGIFRSMIVNAAQATDYPGKICGVFALYTQHKLLLINSGDSRGYLLDRKIRTIDHSVANQLTSRYKSHQHLARHPYRNRVIHYISREKQKYTISEFMPLKHQERLLLCSDGLWRNISLDEILKMNRENFDSLCQQAVMQPLVESDNTTALLLISPKVA